VTTQAKT